MTVKVYIWQPLDILNIRSSRINSLTNRDVGHVSMQINDIYISHRPSSSANNFKQINLLSKLELISQNFSMLSNRDINSFIKIVELIFSKLDKEDKEFICELLKQLGSKNINKDFFKKYMIFDSVSSEVFNNYSYELECKARAREGEEKRKADNCIKIEGLNEDKMLDYYNSLKTPTYHPLTNNCSTFIADIIRKSLNCSSEYSEFCSFCSKRYTPESLKSDNKLKNLFTYLKEVNSSVLVFAVLLVLASIYTRGIIIYYDIFADLSVLTLFTAFGATSLTLQNIPVWTPTLIEKFINQIINQDPFLEQILIKIKNQDPLKNIINQHPLVEKILNQTKIKKCLNNKQ